MKKRLYLIIGETGAGKDTVTDILCKKTGFKKVVSYTDAKIRSDQIDGVHHIFINTDEFDRLHTEGNRKGSVIAYTKIGNVQYMATLDQIDDKTRFYIIDPAGVEALERYFSDKLDILKIYISVPEELRKERTKKRRGYDFEKRMAAEKKQFQEFDKAGRWDIRVENIDLDKTVDTLYQAVTNLETVLEQHEKEVRDLQYQVRYIKLLKSYFLTTYPEDKDIRNVMLREAEHALRSFCGYTDEMIRDVRDEMYEKILEKRQAESLAG